MKRIALYLCLIVGLAAPARADTADAVDAYWRGDYETALREFQALGESGHIVAQVYMAVTYRVGQGTFRDMSLANRWQEAAERFRPGDYHRVIAFLSRHRIAASPPISVKVKREFERSRRNRPGAPSAPGKHGATVARGDVYYLGLGVPQDYVEAARWYFTAARRGDPAGQAYLGIMNLLGHGVLEDAVEGYKWLTLAAEGAPSGADRERHEKMRQRLRDLLTKAGREMGERRAREFRPVTE